MSMMIERVAQAMCESDAEIYGDVKARWYVAQDDYRKLAKAAIEAMMEPTDAVHIAAVTEWDKETNGQGGAYQATRAIVNAYLRQALKDT